MQQRRKILGVKDRVRFVDDRIPVPLLLDDNGRFVVIGVTLDAHLRQDHTRGRAVLRFLPDDEIGIIARLKAFDIQVGWPDMYRVSLLRPGSEGGKQKNKPAKDILHGCKSLVGHKNDSYSPGLLKYSTGSLFYLTVKWFTFNYIKNNS
jgi:hypothetical protein